MTNSAEWEKRRRDLLQQMGSGVALLIGRPRTADDDLALYPKKQDSDFFYLTGVEAPDAAAFISAAKPHFTLFLEVPDPKREIWTGPMMTFAQAKQRFKADLVLPITELEKRCVEVFGSHETIWYTLGSSERGGLIIRHSFNKLKREVRDGVRAPTTVRDVSIVIAEMRLRKIREELAAMRRAQSITTEAFTAAMRAAKPGKYEYEVAAEIEAAFRRHGVVRPAYQSIVCSGPKTCILHCPTYDRKMRAGDLLLIDAGAEWDSYAADVTRTIPVSGKFTKAQRLIYDIVLAAQEAVIAKVKPGTHFDELETTARKVIMDGLVKNNLISPLLPERSRRPSRTENVALRQAQGINALNNFFPHKIGHWLGLDVHDVGSYREPPGKNWRILEPGMALTVEPGLYFPKGTKGVRREFLDIGVRIEDDLLVTKTGHEILSRAIPKKPLDIERLFYRSPQ